MALQAIMPQFSRGITTAMGNASDSVARVGGMADKYLADAREQKRYDTETAYRKEKDALAQANWEKGFGLQQAADERAKAQEARQGTEFDRKLLGEQRLAEYNDRLSGLLTRGEMGDAQAAKVNAEVERLAAQGVTPEQMAGKLGKMAQFSAPQGARATAKAIQGAGFSSPDYSAEPLLRLQESKAKPFLDQAAQEDLYAQQLALTKMKLAADASEGSKNRAAAKERTEKPTPVMMSKILPDGRVQEIPVYTPDQARAYGDQGFMLGKVEGSYKPTGTSKDGTSKIDLQEVGGSGLLGGTSGADLVTLSKRMKNEFKRIPQEAIDAEIQNLSQGWLSDSVDLTELRKNLKAYQ